MRSRKLCGISTRFRMLSPSYGQVTHVLLTRSPLSSQWKQASIEKTVRLACIRHAASVRPEPGSNSHVNVDSCTEILHVKLIALNFLLTLCLRYYVSPSFASTEIEAPCTFGSFILCSVFKGQSRITCYVTAYS